MSYADWKAPKADAERLIWPAADGWARLAADNSRSLNAAADVRIQGVPLPRLRAEMRGFVGIPGETPTFVTGHQTELWHPGVWAKNALIDAAARAAGGLAMHVAVDTDAPKHLNVRWPNYSIPATDDARLAESPWSGALEPPTPSHLATIERDLAAAKPTFGYEPMLGEWIGNLRAVAFEEASGSDLAKAVAAASHRLDWSLGLDYSIQTLSPWLGSRPWLTFVYHVLSRAPQFAADYNASLADYRREQNIDSTSRPIPNLVVTEGQIEVPFWIDSLGDAPRRHRGAVERRDGKLFLHSPYEDAAIELDAAKDADVACEELRAFLLRNQLRIGPRALTLTLFMRLFVADVFVHGIGGGRYDQITDRLIRAKFGIEPPRFGVTTATMFLPQAIGRERACVPCVLQAGHKLKHDVLGERKRELVAAIDAAPRQSSERAVLFATLTRERRAVEQRDERLDKWRDELASMRRRAIEDATVFDREVFYAIQPRERLQRLIEGYRADFGK